MEIINVSKINFGKSQKPFPSVIIESGTTISSSPPLPLTNPSVFALASVDQLIF